MEFDSDKYIKCIRYVEIDAHNANNVIVQTWHEEDGWKDSIIPIDVVPGGTKLLVLPYPLVSKRHLTTPIDGKIVPCAANPQTSLR